jgi:hypothetical protein
MNNAVSNGCIFRILEFASSEKSRKFAAELENYKLSCASSLVISIMHVSLSCESSARLFVYFFPLKGEEMKRFKEFKKFKEFQEFKKFLWVRYGAIQKEIENAHHHNAFIIIM